MIEVYAPHTLKGFSKYLSGNHHFSIGRRMIDTYTYLVPPEELGKALALPGAIQSSRHGEGLSAHLSHFRREHSMSDEDQTQTGTTYTEPPVRINAKQTSKGEYYFEATARGETTEEAVGLLFRTLAMAREQAVAAGYKLAGEAPAK